VDSVDFAGFRRKKEEYEERYRGDRPSVEPVLAMLKGRMTLHANSPIGRLVSELSWIIVVLTGALAPLLVILFAGHTLAWRDTSQLFAPMRSLIAGALREGRLPLWNPYEALGMPLFAQLLHGVLHPWSVLTALVARGDGIDLLISLYVATGAIGAGVLARSLGASRRGAMVAGLGYGLSGYMLGVSAVIQYLAAGGTAPWAVAGLRAAARGGKGRVVLGSVGMAVLHVAGDPQWAIVAALLGALLAWETNGRKGLMWAATAVAVGTALAAIQLIPSWVLLHASSRVQGLSPLEKAQWALSPARIIEFVIPGFFAGRPGAGSDPVYSWLGGKSIYPLPFLPSIFLGFPVLILAVSSIRLSRITRLLGWSALLFLWLSLGHFAGAGRVLGWIPIWGSFRYAEKLIGPFTLCVSILAAVGVERFTDRLLPRTVRPLFIGAATAAVLGALCAGLAGSITPYLLIPKEAWAPLWQRLAVGLLLAAVGLAVFGVAAYRRNRPREGKGSSGTGWIVAAILVTGLAGSIAALHAGSPYSRALRPLAQLRADTPVPRVVTPVNDIALPADRGFDDFDALQAVRSRAGAAPFTVPSRVDNLTTYTGLLPGRFSNMTAALGALGDAQWIAFRRFAVSHVVLTPVLSQPDKSAAMAATRGGRLLQFDPEWNISVWEVPHQPWARFAEQVLPVSTEDEAISAVVRLERAGDRTTVIQGKPPTTLSPGEVLSIDRQPDHVRVEAQAAGDGLLIVTDAFWDGWKATIDGRPVGIEVADGLVRAVRWPAGRHVLDMRYKPAEVRLGAEVSVFTALLLLASLAWRRLPW
jgi:hypothetical protein